MDIGDDLGIGRYIAASTSEHEKIMETIISERVDSPNQGLPDFPQGPHGLNRPPNTSPTVDWNKVREASEWEAQKLEPGKKRAASQDLSSKNSSVGSFRCYHNDCDFQTDDEWEYRKHGAAKHLKNPLLYPTKSEIEKYGLQAQGKEWEK